MAARLVLRNKRNYLAIPFTLGTGMLLVTMMATTGQAVAIAASLAFLVLALAASVRLCRMSVVIHDRGLTIRNPFRRHELAWAEIKSFTHPATNPFYSITVDLISGRRIGLVALDHESARSEHRARQRELSHVDVLNRALHEAHGRTVAAAA